MKMPKALDNQGLSVCLVGEGGFEPPKLKNNRFTVCPLWPLGNSPMYEYGAGGRTRTPDLLITNQLLYQLSYTSILFETVRFVFSVTSFIIIAQSFLIVKLFFHFFRFFLQFAKTDRKYVVFGSFLLAKHRKKSSKCTASAPTRCIQSC